MSGSYVVRLIFPTTLGGDDSPEVLSNWAKDMQVGITVHGADNLTEVFIRVTAGSPYRALMEAVVQTSNIAEALGTDPDAADVMSDREYRRRLSQTNIPVLVDALRDFADDPIGT